MQAASMATPEYFESRTERIPFSGCWIWTAGKLQPNGYAKASFCGADRLLHRVVYELFRGPISSEALDHLCRVRCCLNPWHLEQVSHKENVLRGVGTSATNARKTECFRGHPFAGDNLLVMRGRRFCKICRAIKAERDNENRRARKLAHGT